MVLFIDAKDRVLEFVLPVGCLRPGHVLGVLVVVLDRVDRALDLYELDVGSCRS